jgi:hypothetical protein
LTPPTLSETPVNDNYRLSRGVLAPHAEEM